MPIPEEPAEEKKETPERMERTDQTVWHKYKNWLFGGIIAAFIAYQTNVIPFNYFLIAPIVTIAVYLYSEAQRRGLIGAAIKYRLPDVLDEAERIRNLLLEYKGWRLEFDSVHGAGEHGARAHEPFVIYYRFRKWNEETQDYTDWVIVKQSVLDKNNKNCGIIDIKPLKYKPVETKTSSWSGAPKELGEYAPQVIYRTVEKPIVRTTGEEEGELSEEYEAY